MIAGVASWPSFFCAFRPSFASLLLLPPSAFVLLLALKLIMKHSPWETND
jgi:hypothetical protein